MDEQQTVPKEQYVSKKKLKEDAKFRKEKMGKMRKMTLISALALLIVGGVGFGAFKIISSRAVDTSGGGTPHLVLAETQYDAGTVSMAKGLVEHDYEIKNTGDGDLVIKNLATSCMCTSVILQVGDTQSGKFGMTGMGGAPFYWSQKIAPGQTGYLKVTFDPAYHGPDAVGPIVRAITFATNDPHNKAGQVLLEADVTH